jgi:hypothetical protein
MYRTKTIGLRLSDQVPVSVPVRGHVYLRSYSCSCNINMHGHGHGHGHAWTRTTPRICMDTDMATDTGANMNIEWTNWTWIQSIVFWSLKCLLVLVFDIGYQIALILD